MRAGILLALTTLVAVAPMEARAENGCHVPLIKSAGEYPAWVKAGVSCRVTRNHTPGAASSVSKSPDHGTFDLQENYWSYTPNPGFKGPDTFAYSVATTGRRGSNAFITIDMDVR